MTPRPLVKSSDRRLFLAAAAGALLAPPRTRAQPSPPPPLQPSPQPWPAGRATPALVLPGWQGPAVSLAALHRRPVLINFWASWCAPCRTEMPSLELLATRFEAEGLEVLAVNYRETDGAVRRYVEQTGITLPVLRDRDGAAAQAFGVRIFPTTVAVGRHGRAMFTVVGELDWSGDAARSWLAPVLSSSPR